MLRQKVKSSNLKSIGYDEKKQLLEIEFQNGVVYQYEELPSLIYKTLMKSESHGRYFMAAIRPNFKGRLIPKEEVKIESKHIKTGRVIKTTKVIKEK
jgi:hypothetical protein